MKVLVAAYLLLLIFSGWQAPLSAAESDATSQPLRIGVFNLPPLMEHGQETAFQGWLVDLLVQFENHTRQELQWVGGQREELLQALLRGEIDLLAGVPAANAPADLVFSDTALTSIWGQVFAPEVALMTDYSHLGGRRIAVVRGSVQGEYFADLCAQFALNCQLQWTDKAADAFTLAATGQTDAAVTNHWFGRNAVSAFQIHSSPLRFNPYPVRFLTTADKAELLHTLDAWLAEWREQRPSSYQALQNKWLASGQAETRPLPLWGWILLSLGTLGFLVILLLTLFMRRLMQQREQELRNQTEHAERQRDELLQLIEGIAYGLEEIDAHGKILFSNRMDHQIRRYKQGELVNTSILDMAVSSKEQQRMKRYLAMLAAEQPKISPFYTQAVRKDGVVIDLRLDFEYRRNLLSEVNGFIIVVSDVTESRLLKEKILREQVGLHNSAEKYGNELIDAYRDLLVAATVFETTSEAILALDLEGNIQTVNPAFTKIAKYEEGEVIGKPMQILNSKKNPPDFYPRLWTYLHKHEQWQGEVWNQRKDKTLLPSWLAINAVKDENNVVKQYVALLSDITKRKQYEQQIWRQANYDSLTGLPNRNLFYQRLEQAVQAAQRKKRMAALMFIDLDHFKEVNDTLGHDAGDELLKAATQRIASCVGKGDTVARMGGDEFTVILPHLANSGKAAQVAEMILDKLRRPFPLTAKAVHISGSIGIVLYPKDGETLATLLKNADIAMYRIKEKGRNGFCFFTDDEPAENL